MAKTVEDYLNLIPSQHRGKPKFEAMCSLIAGDYVYMQQFIESMPQEFDIDYAVGVQLDAVGLWVGLSRQLTQPIDGVYFTWNTSDPNEYWNSGVWKGEFDPATSIVEMGDSTYRLALKAKIAANHWDGTIPGAYEIWDILFSDVNLYLLIKDNQDMSMDFTLAGYGLSYAEIQIFIQEEFILKPAGVRIKNFYVTDGPVFTWGLTTSSDVVGGWGVGSWAANYS